jgi:hypothetical protein
VFEAAEGRNLARLAYPLTYWNAAGVFCALGTVLALHAAAGSEEPPRASAPRMAMADTANQFSGSATLLSGSTASVTVAARSSINASAGNSSRRSRPWRLRRGAVSKLAPSTKPVGSTSRGIGVEVEGVNVSLGSESRRGLASTIRGLPSMAISMPFRMTHLRAARQKLDDCFSPTLGTGRPAQTPVASISPLHGSILSSPGATVLPPALQRLQGYPDTEGTLTSTLARTVIRWFGSRLHYPLAGVLTLYLALDAGGYFPGATGVATAVVAVCLLLRITVAAQPFAGWSTPAAVAAGAFALYASWALISSSWSGAAERALIEFDRALLYLLVLAFYATFPRVSGGLGVLLRWLLLAATAVAFVGLAARLIPDISGVTEPLSAERLSHPLTYWNAMGIFCAVGLVLGVHLASARAEPLWMRVLATAAITPLVLAGYFTFSRGAIVAAAIGLVVYLLAARPRGAVFTLALAAPACAVTLQAAYGADLLATPDYHLGDGPEQGRRVATVLIVASVVAGALRALAAPLERRLEGVEVRQLTTSPRRSVVAGAVVLVAAVAVFVAVGAPDRIGREIDAFAAGNALPETGDARDRLTSRGNNGRLEMWRVALDVAKGSPLIGSGAGTFRTEWLQRRESGEFLVNDAHSIYLETWAELGVVGLLLLGVVLALILGAAASRLRGPDRQAAAAVLAAGLALAIHAGIDWDWEMPALFVWLFAAGGVLLAGDGRRTSRAPARLTRVIAGLMCLMLAVTPVLIAQSQSALARSSAAFERGDCRSATDAALTSLDSLRLRAEPFEILGWCNLRAGSTDLARAAMRSAMARDPDNWQYPYGLAVATALSGSDPRPAARRARRLNPLDAQTRRLVRALRGDDPRAWRREAAKLPLPVDR